MARKIDELGRIVIPMEMRSKLHLGKEDAVNIGCVNGKIILTKAKPCCIICHSADSELFTVDEALICSQVLKKSKTYNELSRKTGNKAVVKALFPVFYALISAENYMKKTLTSQPADIYDCFCYPLLAACGIQLQKSFVRSFRGLLPMSSVTAVSVSPRTRFLDDPAVRAPRFTRRFLWP